MLPLQWHQVVSGRFSKSMPAACHGILPFLTFSLHHALSAPTAHLTGYRLMLSICMAPGKTRSLFMTNNRGQYPSRTLFGTQQVKGKQRTVFLTSGQEKSSYSIFCLSALFGTKQVRGKQCTVILTSGEEKLIYSIFPLVLHSARSR